MPVPKYKTSKTKRNMRRSHHALKSPSMSVCESSGEVKHPHCIGPTGYFKGRLVDPKRAAKAGSSASLSDDDIKGL